jgi:hypothetical protein
MFKQVRFLLLAGATVAGLLSVRLVQEDWHPLIAATIAIAVLILIVFILYWGVRLTIEHFAPSVSHPALVAAGTTLVVMIFGSLLYICHIPDMSVQVGEFRSHPSTSIRSIRFGILVFNNPSPMKADRSGQVEALLSLKEDAEDLIRALTVRGASETAQIEISDRMRATLRGAQFKVVPLSPEVSAISEWRRTTWKWDVTPTKSGTHPLTLTVSAVVKIGGVDTDVGPDIFTKDISVEVDFVDEIRSTLKSNAQWLWGSIIVPIAGAIWLWLKQKRRKGWVPW